MNIPLVVYLVVAYQIQFNPDRIVNDAEWQLLRVRKKTNRAIGNADDDDDAA